MPTSAAGIAATQARRTESSVARVEANRRNAQRSTGPRTAEGKAKVSENAEAHRADAVKPRRSSVVRDQDNDHRLRSTRNPLELSSETALDFEREAFATTLSGFLADLAPVGTLETQLVERLAQINLRLNRAIRMETTHLEMALAETRADARSAGSSLATDDAFILTLSFLRKPEALKLISQYESRLSRDFARTLTQLRQAQKLRTAHTANALCAMEEVTKQTQHPTLSRVRQRPVANNAGEQTQREPAALSAQGGYEQREESAPLCAMKETTEQTQPSVAAPMPAQFHPTHGVELPETAAYLVTTPQAMRSPALPAGSLL